MGKKDFHAFIVCVKFMRVLSVYLLSANSVPSVVVFQKGGSQPAVGMNPKLLQFLANN